MSNPSAEADALRAEMAGVRSLLDENVHQVVEGVHGIVEGARNLTDWRYYVKSVPLGAVAAAAAVGYFSVPKRTQVVRPDAEELAKMARDHRVFLDTKPHAETKSKGPAQIVFTMLANAALRAGTAYVSQQAGKMMGKQAAEPSPDEQAYSGQPNSGPSHPGWPSTEAHRP